MTDIAWCYFPKHTRIPDHLSNIVKTFENNSERIASSSHNLESNEVLTQVMEDLTHLGFQVEKSKRIKDTIPVPVLFGLNGKVEKSFAADAFNKETKTVLEVEAGRALANYQFLKDLFEASMMENVESLAIAVRQHYRNSKDFKKIITFFDTLYSSGRIQLPLKGILIIGY